MNPSLQQMRAARVQDAGDLRGYAPLRGAQVYGVSNGFLGAPVGFLIPYLRNGVPWITAGYVDGLKIEGSDGPLPALGAETTVYVVCRTSREMLELDDFQSSLLSGRYTLDFARLALEPENEVEIVSPTLHRATTSKDIFTTTASGNLPAGSSGKPHYHIDPTNLTF